MPATPSRRTDRRLYQPRLPLPGTPGPGATREGRPRGAAGPTSTTNRARVTTNRARVTTDRRTPAAGNPTPRPASSDGAQSWRLDEKTRRAGRQGVAAARAALAGTAAPEHDRRADAA